MIMENYKFQIGDKARVCCNAPREIIYITDEDAKAVLDGDFSKYEYENAGVKNDFLKHFFEIGTEVEIAGLFTGWKGHEAYNIKGSTEILLAEELERIES